MQILRPVPSDTKLVVLPSFAMLYSCCAKHRCLCLDTSLLAIPTAISSLGQWGSTLVQNQTKGPGKTKMDKVPRKTMYRTKSRQKPSQKAFSGFWSTQYVPKALAKQIPSCLLRTHTWQRAENNAVLFKYHLSDTTFFSGVCLSDFFSLLHGLNRQQQWASFVSWLLLDSPTMALNV